MSVPCLAAADVAIQFTIYVYIYKYAIYMYTYKYVDRNMYTYIIYIDICGIYWGLQIFLPRISSAVMAVALSYVIDI